MKGQLLSRSHSSCGPLPDILCVAFTQRHEWDPRNAIITGCTDGIIRVRFPPLWSEEPKLTLRLLVSALSHWDFYTVSKVALITLALAR